MITFIYFLKILFILIFRDPVKQHNYLQRNGQINDTWIIREVQYDLAEMEKALKKCQAWKKQKSSKSCKNKQKGQKYTKNAKSFLIPCSKNKK